MTDISLTDGAWENTAFAEGITEDGIEFVDSWSPESGEMVSTDAGQITIKDEFVSELIKGAKSWGLTVSDDR